MVVHSGSVKLTTVLSPTLDSEVVAFGDLTVNEPNENGRVHWHINVETPDGWSILEAGMFW